MIFLYDIKGRVFRMENQAIQMAQRYLRRFDQILGVMAYKMLSARPIDNITLYFIKCMVPHHQAAIYMCENLLQYSPYKPLEKIAQNIIIKQTEGIEQMREIARTTRGFKNTKMEVMNYTKQYLLITNNMLERMKNSPRSVNINLSFVGEMIPHHEGAIGMCHNLLQYRIDPRLQRVAESIIQEQSKGVEELKAVREILCK